MHQQSLRLRLGLPSVSTSQALAVCVSGARFRVNTEADGVRRGPTVMRLPLRRSDGSGYRGALGTGERFTCKSVAADRQRCFAPEYFSPNNGGPSEVRWAYAQGISRAHTFPVDVSIVVGKPRVRCPMFHVEHRLQ